MSTQSGDNHVTNLLLLLCRDSLTEDEKKDVGVLASCISDWGSFCDLALKNGVAALAWYNLNDSGFGESVPENEKMILEGVMMQTITRVTFIANSAAEITEILNNEGIKSVLLKGLALEHTVYGNKGLRQMSDADILVSPEECLRARDILEKHGFVSRPLKSPLYNKIILFIGNHIPEMHKNGVSVDIHHRLFGTEGISLTKEGIENSEAIKISGRVCQILPSRIAFLGMIKHLQKHDLKGEFQVRLFVDLYLMLKYYGEKILSDSIASEAETAGISKELASGLYLVSHYWNFPVHEKYTALLTASEKEAISSYFIEGLTNPGISVTGGFNDLYSSNLNALPGTKNKLIFLLGDIFPSVSFMKGRYNCKTLFCIFIHYPYRIGKIFWFIRSLIRH